MGLSSKRNDHSKQIPYVALGMLLGVVGTLTMSHMWHTGLCASCPPCSNRPTSLHNNDNNENNGNAPVFVSSHAAQEEKGIARYSAEGLSLDPVTVSRVLRQHWWELPCRGDAEAILPVLKLVYRTETDDAVERNGVLVDIGANVGQTSSAILAQFGAVDFKAFVRSQGNAEVKCGKAGTQLDAKLFAFEPGKKVGQKLARHAKERGWADDGFELLRIAVGSFDGVAQFRDDGGETASLISSENDNKTSSSSSASTKNVYEVEVATVATLHRKYFSHFSDKIFLLKMDCEGFDPLALQGSQSLFEAKKVKFLLFEYNKVWFTITPTILLETVVGKLHDAGYVCFFLTPRHLLPISGRFWHESFEIRQWSNVFCGLQGDEDLLRVLEAFHLAPGSSQLKHHSTYDEYFFHCKGKECAVKNTN